MGRGNKKKQAQNKKKQNKQAKQKNKYGKPQSKQSSILGKLQASNDIIDNQYQESSQNNDYYNDYHGNKNNNNYYNGNGRNNKNKKNKNKHHYQNNKKHNNNNKWKQKGGGKSELNQFFDQLRPLGLGIRNARSDGNCLFRAISDQISGDENNQARFRKEIVQYMTEHNDEFAPFYVGDYEAYLKKMSKNGIWGGNMELTAAAKAFHVDIVIHSLNAARYEILYQKGKPERTIHLSYHNERHYASVRRLNDMSSNRPAAVINLDKTHIEKMQREQQRAEIAWCHNGGDPLAVENAKDEISTLTPAEQLVVARTNCWDIPKVKEALQCLDGNIDAAVETIMVDMSLMANEHKEKTIKELEKQKEEDEKNKQKKKKKKKKNKHKNKGKNNKKEQKENTKEEKDKEEQSKKQNKKEIKKDEIVTNECDDNDEEREPETNVSSNDLKSAVIHDEDLEAKLAKMKAEVHKKETTTKKKEKSLDEILSVKVKIVNENKMDDKKENKHDNNTDIKIDLDKKNQVNVNEKKEDKVIEKEEKEVKEENKENELLDDKYYEERDNRINKERLNMNKIKCVYNGCNFQHELLLIYLKHYKFVHLQKGTLKNKDTKDIKCVFGHKNQANFSFCSECGWDLRYKPKIPEKVQKKIQKENKKPKSQSQPSKPSKPYNISQINAKSLLNTGGKAIVIHKNSYNKPNKPNAHTSSLINKYKHHMHKYWTCKQCTFVNPHTNIDCMVCSMLNGTKCRYNNTKNNKNINKADEYPPLNSNSNKNDIIASNNWVAMAAKNNKPKCEPKPKPKPQPIKQKKHNAFGWICEKCTFENKPADQKCNICNNNKPKKGGKKQKNKAWNCKACSKTNNKHSTCDACGNPKGGVTNVYHAEPHYDFDENDLKNELDSYNNNKWQSNNDEKEQNTSEQNNNWSVKGNDKCKCGSGKKYKKCCKKLEKHDKSWKNKFKHPEFHNGNHHGNHHGNYDREHDLKQELEQFADGDDNKQPNTDENRNLEDIRNKLKFIESDTAGGYIGNGNSNAMDPIDQLNTILKSAEREIINFKGKKNKKNQLIRELVKTKEKRDSLLKKLDSDRNKAYKTQNKRNRQKEEEMNRNKRKNNTNQVYINNGSNNNGGNASNNAAANMTIAI